MVSKTVIAMLFGQIILALIFFYFLPISGATENAPKLINTKSQPIITLSQGKWIFKRPRAFGSGRFLVLQFHTQLGIQFTFFQGLVELKAF